MHVGASATTTSMAFTYYNEPVSQMLFPVAGKWEGGATTKVSGQGFFATPVTLCRFTVVGSSGTNSTTPGTFNAGDGSMTCPYPALNVSGLQLAGSNLVDNSPQAAGWSVTLHIALNGQQYSPHGQTFMYFATPVGVSSINPPLGPKSGGERAFPATPPCKPTHCICMADLTGRGVWARSR